MGQATSVGIFTIGYEGKALESFVEELLDAEIEVLVDVREIPTSRKKGFSKTALAARVNDAGIRYLHFKSLGSPRYSRKKLRESGDFEVFSREYAEHLDKNGYDVDALVELISGGQRAALMCFERNYERCHRHLLVQELFEEAVSELRAYHL